MLARFEETKGFKRQRRIGAGIPGARRPIVPGMPELVRHRIPELPASLLDTMNCST